MKNSKHLFAIAAIIASIALIVYLTRQPAAPQQSTEHEGSVHNEDEQHSHDVAQMESMKAEIVRLEKVIKENPSDIESLLNLAHLYQDSGNLFKSIETYNEYLLHNPKNADARIDLGVSYYQMAYEDTLKQKEYFDTAISTMQEALKYSPKHVLGHFNLGIVNWQNGNSEKAAFWFNKCIALDSTSSVAEKAKQILQQHLIN
ncbi:MAG: tetratricopeptide repeat protein [Bacteroidota bacterium]|nr:tetratricopeptide repeat protein [Bacteroidota bacterium]